MKRRSALQVVGLLFILAGACGAFSMAEAALFEHRLHIAVDVLGLWIGPGLLRHDPRYRRWALRLLIADFVLAPVAAVMLILQPRPFIVQILAQPVGTISLPAALAALATFVAVAVWAFRVLRRPHVRALFEAGVSAEPPEKAATLRNVRTTAAGVALALAVLMFVGAGHDFRLHFDLSGVVPASGRPGPESRVVVLQDADRRRWVARLDAHGGYVLSGWQPRMPAVLFVCDLGPPAHQVHTAFSITGTAWLRDALSFHAAQGDAACAT